MILFWTDIIMFIVYFKIFVLKGKANNGSRGTITSGILHAFKFAIYEWMLFTLLFTGAMFFNIKDNLDEKKIN